MPPPAEVLHDPLQSFIEDHRLRAYRKAAWAIEDLEPDIRLIYQALGLRGLQNITNVGNLMGEKIEKLLNEII